MYEHRAGIIITYSYYDMSIKCVYKSSVVLVCCVKKYRKKPPDFITNSVSLFESVMIIIAKRLLDSIIILFFGK